MVVGGLAVLMQGGKYFTEDLDIAFERTRDNAKRIASALRQFEPRPRGFPPDVPFIFDEQAILLSQVLTLSTTIGDIDLLGEVSGIGTFREIVAQADDADYMGIPIKVLSVDALITAKTAANRPKDQPGLEALKALRAARAELAREEHGTDQAAGRV